jgi:hypothetical protein
MGQISGLLKLDFPVHENTPGTICHNAYLNKIDH